MSRPANNSSSTWNYIIVGGGSAGCVVAARLSERPENRVLLLEAGGGLMDRLPFVSAPGGTLYLSMNRLFDWNDQMQPDPTCNGREEILNGGKLLGGGSSINGMMFIRGNKEDYDEWARLGNAGWSYSEVLPYFKKMENTRIGLDEYHGRKGPLGVEEAASMLDVSHRFIEAAVQAGIAPNPDINGSKQDGVARTPCSTLRGVRQSTALAYLRPAMRRSNLTVITGAHAQKVLFDRQRARGVEFVRRGQRHTVLSSGEIVLSAGAVRSPQLLLLSGVGPAAELKKLPIGCVLDLPGVGRNHMEHPAAGVIYEVTLPTWNRELRLHRQLINGLDWLLRKRGHASSGYSQAVAFVRTHASLPRPDLQLTLIPLAVTFAGGRKRVDTSRNMVKVLINACQPQGRGRLELASADAMQPPLIFPRLLDGDSTLTTMMRGIAITREIFGAPALRPFVRAEVTPGTEKTSRSELESWLREATVDTVHPSGTCKMGQDDMAVVDERLRVRGIDRLRVADASIMPTITTGNTNAPAIMIGEKAAAMILEDDRHA